jgi:hypothetical protein
MSHLINMRKIAISLAMFATVALASGTIARADTVTFSGSGTNPASGQALSASADFTLTGSTLTVTLTNTSAADVLVPSDVLTGVFFSSNGTLTPVSALLNTGSTVFFGSDGGGNVGGEWVYTNGLVGAPGGATKGIYSAGFGFAADPNFGGTNLQDPDGVDGLQYGITSAGDNTGNGNAAVTGGNALIKNSVVFTLTVANGFTLASITDVSFQYGTALNEPNLTNIPEPTSMLLLGSGLVGLAAGLRRRLRR